MAHLFVINEKTVSPNPETLLIYPFKEIWERDKTLKKVNAIEEFAYIEFMSSMLKSNPFRQYPDEKKEEVIRKAIITQKDWAPDGLITDGIATVESFQKKASTTYMYYISAKKAAENMQDFFSNVNIRDDINFKTGNPIYKPKDITSALIDTEKVLANIKALEKKVDEELFEGLKTRSDKQISPFADPSSL